MDGRFFTLEALAAVPTGQDGRAALARTSAAGLDEEDLAGDDGSNPLHDPPLAARDEAVFLLTAAAEIEHALMVQYLFAAYSVRTAPSAVAELQVLQGLLTETVPTQERRARKQRRFEQDWGSWPTSSPMGPSQVRS